VLDLDLVIRPPEPSWPLRTARRRASHLAVYVKTARKALVSGYGQVGSWRSRRTTKLLPLDGSSNWATTVGDEQDAWPVVVEVPEAMGDPAGLLDRRFTASVPPLDTPLVAK